VPDSSIAREADFCCYVSGHSMEPLFSDGDLICVKAQQSVDIGEIGIFVLNGEMYIKKLGANELISLNSDYPNIKNSPDIKCQGKVLGKI
jgi:SOS-response transcriptional repressor LexA